MTIKRNILLNPGPVTTTDTVKQALVVADICHREVEFTDLMQGVRMDLLKVVNADPEQYTSILFAASGTGAVEACLSSVLASEKKVLIINNGPYGQRMLDIARRYHIPSLEYQVDYDQPIAITEIELLLIQNNNIGAVAMVHHETSSGILSSLRPIGELCHKYGCEFIVDAMSSFAGVDIDVEREHIDYIISSANKCLQGMPGLAFVIAKKSALMQSKGRARSFYFDLHQQFYALETQREMPFTPPVQIIYALRQALNEFLAETLSGRIERYQRNYELLIKGFAKLGFTCLTPEDRASHLLAIIRFPGDQSYNFDEFHDYLFAAGFTIYPKKLSIPNTFRVACLGAIEPQDILRFFQSVATYMLKKTTQELISHV